MSRKRKKGQKEGDKCNKKKGNCEKRTNIVRKNKKWREKWRKVGERNKSREEYRKKKGIERGKKTERWGNM